MSDTRRQVKDLKAGDIITGRSMVLGEVASTKYTPKATKIRIVFTDGQKISVWPENVVEIQTES